MQSSMQAIPIPCIPMYGLDFKKLKMQAIPDLSSIQDFVLDSAIPRILGGLFSLSFWFFWVLLTGPYSTFLLTVICQ